MVVGTCRLQSRQPLPWGRSPVSFKQIGLDLAFQGKSWDKGPSSLALPRMVHCQWLAAPDVIWHIYSHLYCSLRYGGRELPSSGEAVPTMEQCPLWVSSTLAKLYFSAGGSWRHLAHLLHPALLQGVLGMDLLSSGDVAFTMGQVPCEFQSDQPNFIFQLAAPDVIWHIYSHLYCSSRDGSRDLSSSGEAAPTMGQVPCEFRADRPNFIFQPVAPDVIWHIYSHLHCSSTDGGRDLQSSGYAAPTMGQVPCEFWADQPGYSFSGEELRQESFQSCPAQDGASSMAGGSGHDLAHLLTPVLLIEGGWQGLAIFRGGSPYHGAGPLWVSSRLAKLHFSAGGSWCDLAHLLTLVLLLKVWW